MLWILLLHVHIIIVDVYLIYDFYNIHIIQLVKHSKLKLKTSPTCVDSSTLDEIVTSKYDLVYCDINYVNVELNVNLHNRGRMASSV